MNRETLIKKFNKRFTPDWALQKARGQGYFMWGAKNDVAVIKAGPNVLEQLPCSIVISNGVKWHDDCHVYNTKKIWSHLVVMQNPGYKVEYRSKRVITPRNQKYLCIDIGKSHRLAKTEKATDYWIALALDAPEKLPKEKVLRKLHKFLNLPKKEFTII
jgi:hypothetical protein